MSESTAGILSPHFPRLPGYVRVARIGGASLDVHWSCFIGGVVLSAPASFDPRLMLPLIVGYLLVVLVHEMGHAIAARSQGLPVYGIRLRGMGGHCVVGVTAGARATFIVFSAGLVAQLLLFLATLQACSTWTRPEPSTPGAFVFAFTFGNAVAFVFSLIPSTSRNGLQSDGRVLWRLAIDRWHGRTVLGGTLPSLNAAARSPVFGPQTSLLDVPALVPDGFLHGVEIFNDRHTPLDFVIGVLMQHLGREGRAAIADAVGIHNRGGLLVALPSMAEAERVAGAIAKDATTAGHPFLCRAVSVQARRPAA